MPSYVIKMDASTSNITEQIEALRGIGSVELLVTVEAPTKARAAIDLIEVVEEINATYKGVYTGAEEKDSIRNGLKAVRKTPLYTNA